MATDGLCSFGHGHFRFGAMPDLTSRRVRRYGRRMRLSTAVIRKRSRLERGDAQIRNGIRLVLAAAEICLLLAVMPVALLISGDD